MGGLLIENLTKSFRVKAGGSLQQLVAFDNLNIAAADGEFVSVVGPSGCGKSTLLNLVAGLDLPSGGSVRIDGKVVVGPGLDRGVVFQEFALFPWLTVLGNVVFGLKSKGMDATERSRLARHYIRLVGLGGFEDYYPNRLSGGMRQRVGIARALAIEPSVLLMDEPFGALDAQTRQTLQKALVDIWQSTRKTVLFITHDIDEAVYLSDRVVVLSRRPAGIVLDLPIPLERPRNRHDPVFQELTGRIEAAIGGEHSAVASPEPSMSVNVVGRKYNAARTI
jgi:NitT/TauT family transport system ATP-binding protein